MLSYRKLFLASLAIVSALTVSCINQMEEPQQPQQGNSVTLTTTVGIKANPATKALGADGKKTFAENDQITFVYKNTSGQTTVAFTQLTASDISADGKTATISVTMDSPAENGQLRLIYPSSMAQYNIANDATIDDEHTIDYQYLRNSQNGFLDNLGSNFDLAVYDGTMNGDQLPASITLANKLTICAYTIKNSDGTQDLTSTITNLTVSDGIDTYTISRSAGVGPIYVAMKPVSGADITLTATDENGQHYTKSVTNKTYAANNIYPLGMRMTETYKTYSTLPVGTLLKLGDQIALSTNVHINSDPWVETSKAPFTLVRANVSGETVTEAADGTHYVLKDKDGGFHLQENNFLVSEATDGLIVASYNEPNNSYVCCTHVNLAAIDINNLPTESSYPNKKYYTAHTYDCLYGTLDGDVKLFIPDGDTVWLGGMTHHSGKYVCGIECLGSALINLVDGTTNDLTPGNDLAYAGIFVKAGTLTIDGTGTLLATGCYNYAGIGGLNSDVDIVINGGNLTVAGGANAAGIGANYGHNIGDITINGGNLTVTGGTNAAGIGCGSSGEPSYCGNITFNDGTVVVKAGIDGWGVGMYNTQVHSCGDIKFVGGKVTVNGWIATKYSYSSIYVDGVDKGSLIHADSSNPFVYPVPATQ